jgi:hypothetical protein
MASPIWTLLEMVWMLASNSVTTVLDLMVLFSRLIGELGMVSSSGGIYGTVASIAIIAIVGYMIAKFIMGAEKTIIILIILGLILLWIVVLSSLG